MSCITSEWLSHEVRLFEKCKWGRLLNTQMTVSFTTQLPVYRFANSLIFIYLQCDKCTHFERSTTINLLKDRNIPSWCKNWMLVSRGSDCEPLPARNVTFKFSDLRIRNQFPAILSSVYRLKCLSRTLRRYADA